MQTVPIAPVKVIDCYNYKRIKERRARRARERSGASGDARAQRSEPGLGAESRLRMPTW
jgi:hypothetical protein